MHAYIRNCIVLFVCSACTALLHFVALLCVSLHCVVLKSVANVFSQFKYFSLGLEPIIIENVLVGDHLETDTLRIKNVVDNIDSENILCVLTTTSCFAPRIPDKYDFLLVPFSSMEKLEANYSSHFLIFFTDFN